jgi:hypothetical protein
MALAYHRGDNKQPDDECDPRKKTFHLSVG